MLMKRAMAQLVKKYRSVPRYPFRLKSERPPAKTKESNEYQKQMPDIAMQGQAPVDAAKTLGYDEGGHPAKQVEILQKGIERQSCMCRALKTGAAGTGTWEGYRAGKENTTSHSVSGQ